MEQSEGGYLNRVRNKLLVPEFLEENVSAVTAATLVDRERHRGATLNHNLRAKCWTICSLLNCIWPHLEA